MVNLQILQPESLITGAKKDVVALSQHGKILKGCEFFCSALHI